MRASRGMGDIAPSKMPKKKVIHRTDNPNDVEMYAKGGHIAKHSGPIQVSKVPGSMAPIVKGMLKNPGKLKASDMFAKGGLYENIHKKQARIAAGSGEKMRKPGSKGAPTKQDFIESAKTRKKK
jgi:hypothetical protein